MIFVIQDTGGKTNGAGVLRDRGGSPVMFVANSRKMPNDGKSSDTARLIAYHLRDSCYADPWLVSIRPPAENGSCSLTQRLRLPDGQSQFSFVPPEVLYVCEHFDYLFVAEPIPKCWHSALEARILGVFQRLSTLADNSVQEARPHGARCVRRR